mgnify:FL=1
MRHGEASFQADSDINRALTDRGRAEVLQSIKSLIDQSCKIDSIWSSPYLRARQTAEIALSELGGSVQVQPCLTPDYNPSKVTDWLAQLNNTVNSVLITSHMPLVGKLVSLMTEGDLSRPVSFVTGMVVHLHADEPFDGCFTLKRTFPT